jgi:hypothetical protein
MTLLEQAVGTVRGWDASRAGERGQCLALLELIAARMQEALAIWQTHRDAPIELDPKRAVTTLVRPDAAKRLNDLHYQTKDAARQLMDLTGVPFIDTFDLCEELAIELAYRQLKLGETIPYVCVKSVENQQRRLGAVEQALSGLRLS